VHDRLQIEGRDWLLTAHQDSASTLVARQSKAAPSPLQGYKPPRHLCIPTFSIPLLPFVSSKLVAIMHSNDSTYVHTRFVHQDSIRHLGLLPGLRGSPLKSNIIIVRKGNNPEYEALSYAWGDPTPLHPIQEISSGTVLRIATSLEQALQAIRGTDVPRVLWIDAICINQSNIQEKGHQVALMDQLYHDARRGIVWLPCKGCRPTRVECVLKDFINAHIADEEVLSFTIPHQVVNIKKILARILMMKIFDEPWCVETRQCQIHY
jgi:hypothetical protein